MLIQQIHKPIQKHSSIYLLKPNNPASAEYRIVGKFGGGKFGELIDQLIQMYVCMLIIVSTNLVGFSLENHGRFTKFIKLLPCQTFSLYGSTKVLTMKFK